MSSFCDIKENEEITTQNKVDNNIEENDIIEILTKLNIDEKSLLDIFQYLKSNLTSERLTEFVSKLNAIRDVFTGDGAGLSGGIVSDKFTMAFLSLHLSGFTEHHVGESDCAIQGYPLSLKKINGKSTIALNWSKNPENSIKRDRFNNDIILLNLRTEQWWKTAPKSASSKEREENFFTTTIKAGIYLISKTYCKSNVCLKSNNKTDTLIENIQLYRMIKNSIQDDLFIEFPTTLNEIKFDILKAFSHVHPIDASPPI